MGEERTREGGGGRESIGPTYTLTKREDGRGENKREGRRGKER